MYLFPLTADMTAIAVINSEAHKKHTIYIYICLFTEYEKYIYINILMAAISNATNAVSYKKHIQQIHTLYALFIYQKLIM